MQRDDLRFIRDEELILKVRKLKLSLWVTLALVILMQLFLLFHGSIHFLFIIVVYPLAPLFLRKNKYYQEYKRRNLDK